MPENKMRSFVPSANIQNGISLNDRLSGSHYHIPHIYQKWSSSHKLQTWHTHICWQTYTCSDAVHCTYIWKSIGVLVLMLDLERQRRYICKSLRFWHRYWMKRRQCGWHTWKPVPCDNSQRRGIWFAVFIIGGAYIRTCVHSFVHTYTIFSTVQLMKLELVGQMGPKLKTLWWICLVIHKIAFSF